ncbi:hypothetical protein CYMTET_55933 [Cymbomonas tetramitiformis]|uniref:Uncharacterized protein n=1 Tax=Cymbomonas tetramitiformis TaxID=36881 RepID=A0AAE0BCB1_9CHLO|nr:hypothetical protein CYMTET_55933 [Cymbomonas tetramitiformis]
MEGAFCLKPIALVFSLCLQLSVTSVGEGGLCSGNWTDVRAGGMRKVFDLTSVKKIDPLELLTPRRRPDITVLDFDGHG